VLREKIRTARAEQVPFAAIARAAGLSRERVRQLYAGN
jgi:DNA-directed RNA polymerase sigma subunit (sigma70/sigma32)